MYGYCSLFVEKSEKTASKWTVPENLHWIHLEGKFSEVVLSDGALGLEHGSRTHRASLGTWHWQGRHWCAHLGFCLCRSIFKEKVQKPILETFVSRGGKEPKMSCLLELNLWQICRSGFPLYECTRSWALQGLLERPAQAPWAQSDLQTFSQFLRTPSSPNSWH